MWIYLSIFFVVLIIAVIIFLFSNISAIIGYNKEKGFFIYLKLLFIKFKIYPSNIKNKKPSSITKKEKADKKINYIDSLQSIIRIINFCRFKLTINDFRITIKIGTDDAAETALLCGGMYGIIYSALGTLQNVFFVKKPTVNVLPQYNMNTASCRFVFSVRARIITLIRIGLYLIKEFKNK